MDSREAEASEASPMGKKKPRTCPHCKRHFRRYEHLQRHIRIHTNEKPYKCSCGASFSRRDLLKRHNEAGHSPLSPLTRQISPHAGDDAQTLGSHGSGTYHPTQNNTLWELPQTNDDTAGSIETPGNLAGYQSIDAPPFFNTYDPLEDFEAFTHNMGLALDWTLPSEPTIGQFVARDPNFQAIPKPASWSQSQDHPTISHPDQSVTQLPAERNSIDQFGVLTLPILSITQEHRDRLQSLVQSPISMVNLALPSSQSLTRFVNAFFDGFYPHMPVVHIPTFTVEQCPAEIILSMAALGAQYRHEHRKGVTLFYAAKAIFQERLQQRDRDAANGNSSIGHTSCQNGRRPSESIQEARCALYLIAFATWQCEPEIVREAFDLQSFLARSVREAGLEDSPETLQSMPNWHSWIEQETHRRVKIFTFALLNLQSIAFNLPPVFLSDEVKLRLPCSCAEWIAPSEEKWSLIHKSDHREQMMFQDALAYLAKGPREPRVSNIQPVPSPLANYILLHAIIQQVMILHQAFRLHSDGQNSLLDTQKDNLRNSLRAWTFQWQQAPESSLDPRNPNGPVTFTSIALLGLAYVRLAFDIGSYRILQSRDPTQIANRLCQIPRLPPGPHLLPAILHAAHALSIPVKLGVSYVSRSHAFVWSIQHSLCGLEFAVFLSRWLYCIHHTRTKRLLDEHETRLISWISDILEEGRTSGDEDMFPGPVVSSDCAYMAYAAVKLWARLIKGNDQWAILGVIGESLDIFAAICRHEYLSQQAGS